jgi:hypothetical protein
MKTAFFIEGNPNNPGGYNQILNTTIFIKNSFNKNDNILFITNDINLKNLFKKNDVSCDFYTKNIFEKLTDYILGLSFLLRFLIYFNFKHSFSKFLKKREIDLVIFLSPTEFSRYCDNVNFVLNIWDLDHKKNSPFPEHKNDYTFEKREDFLKSVLFKAFKIVVAHKENKKDLIKFYSCDEKKIVIQSFIPLLPNIPDNELGSLTENEKINLKSIISKNKIIIYPATFWAHKNHKYIIEAVEILKKNNINEFRFIFCGSDRGNFDYIKQLIEKKKLSQLITMYPLVSNLFLKNLYENCFAVIMATDSGPTNLPLYESMYFNKPILYSNKISNDNELKDIIFPINLSDPEDLVNKLKDLNKETIIEKVNKGQIYYQSHCLQKNIHETYKNIIDEFNDVKKKWEFD